MAKPHVQILLIEDDEDDYILAEDSLTHLPEWQVELTWASNAEDGMALLDSQHFDLCLLDYQLGKVTGIDVLKQIKDRDINTPVVMLTGQADKAIDEAALFAGATDYLLKSDVDSGRFVRTIRYALARRDTERERLERQKAESANRSKDRFLAHLSHELRTPLSAILGYTELLLSKQHSTGSTELNAILRNGRHLLSLLNDVLDLSKIAADKLELTPSQTQFHGLLNEVVALTHALALEKKLALNLRSLTPIPVEIFVDTTRLRQVLINLIGNAIKFTQSGRVDVEVEVIDDKSHSQLHIAVRDTGIGISDAHLRKIFQPFEQVDDVVHKTEQGTGLGLAICAELVQRMGGYIHVESEPGKGSCFSILLPLTESIDQPRKMLEHHSDEYRYQLQQAEPMVGKVLVVDDMEDLRSMMQAQMSACGIQAVGACHGLDAIKKVKESLDSAPFDLIFLDLHMPVMDGYSAIKELRTLMPDIPIVALTAATLKGRAEQLLSIGFTAMLGKPMERRVLLENLQHYLQPPQLEDFNQTQVTKKLLLVEDDCDAAQATAAMLQLYGCDVDIASTAADCLDMLNQATYHRLVVDLGLPDMDGLQLISEIRKTNPSVEVFILSGSDVEQTTLKQFNIAQHYQKPLFGEQIKRLSE